MKKSILTLTLVVLMTLVFSCHQSLTQDPKKDPAKQQVSVKKQELSGNDWENPAVFAVNKEAPHTAFVPFPDKDSAIENDRKKSIYCQSLNGSWKFNWSKKPADRPRDFYKPDFDVSQWKDIPVPSNWQLEDFGIPIYLNTQYPFKKDPPNIPHDYNPVGSYRTTFTIGDSWKDRQIYLHFGAVKSAMYLWINGEKVGYSQGSKLPVTFESGGSPSPLGL